MTIDDLPMGPKRIGAVLQRDNYLCQICGTAPATEVDHKWPKSAGGKDDASNLQAACKFCNQSKGDTLQTNYITPQTAWWTYAHYMDRAATYIESAARWHDNYEKVKAGLDPYELRDVTQATPAGMRRVLSELYPTDSAFAALFDADAIHALGDNDEVSP